MGYKVDNAVIMAAGTASRFAPLSYERPKALIEVKGEVLIERQIRQLQEAGISEIIIAKQRNGPIGTVNLAWLPEYTRFANLLKSF